MSFNKIGGEIIDVSISNKNSTHIIKINDTIQHETKNSDLFFYTPTITYLIKDISMIIFDWMN